jgi:hypothetical protein
MRITTHAVERWIQRVDPRASVLEARFALEQFVALGRMRPVPRHWMRGQVRQEPGTCFIYNATHPGACAVVTNTVVVTVVTKDLFGAPRRHLRLAARPPITTLPASERARWRWMGELPDVGEAA